MTTDLDPLDPATGREMYLDERSHELADATIRWYRYRLGGLVRWRDRERRGDALSPSPTERIDRLGDPDVFATDRNAAEVAVDRVQ